MALKSRSMFLYGFQVTELNRSIDFRITLGGDVLAATLSLGFYSLQSLMIEVVRALKAAAPDYNFSYVIDRTAVGGLENRVKISTTSEHFELLFATGDRSASSACTLLGYDLEEKTGATEYLSDFTAGIAFSPSRYGYEWIEPNRYAKNAGSVNVSASGVTEFITWGLNRFCSVRFKYIPTSEKQAWIDLLTWLIAKRPIEFTPEVSSPTTAYEAYLESTTEDSGGLGYKLIEMLPNYVDLFDTGLLKFRLSNLSR